ncbi:hypothetical protein LPB73_14860 [Tardiphaga sp. 37S4]|uniref:hypothetical protein n=1 Tax=Tardiphaga sp. 37S4 TaxID=1404741 RepID=UPI001E643A3C|nr:hypothetical protein [Tardiphaga sp. 37S4]UFS78577.1 hypothetical protein LPB73_14860 [Tardiphaga sp. 37S4]
MVNKPPIQRARGFTPAAIENVRQRYEETNESLEAIAADFNCHRSTVERLARVHGWMLRKERVARDLPAALQLDLAVAQVLDASTNGDDSTERPVSENSAADAGAPLVEPSLALRLELAVAKELEKVERLRSETGSAARRTIEAERIARTLSALTQTLFKVRRLRETGSSIADDHDQLPSDADEFRHELARRIDAFVRSRSDAGVARPDESSGAASPPSRFCGAGSSPSGACGQGQ